MATRGWVQKVQSVGHRWRRSAFPCVVKWLDICFGHTRHGPLFPNTTDERSRDRHTAAEMYRSALPISLVANPFHFRPLDAERSGARVCQKESDNAKHPKSRDKPQERRRRNVERETEGNPKPGVTVLWCLVAGRLACAHLAESYRVCLLCTVVFILPVKTRLPFRLLKNSSSESRQIQCLRCCLYVVRTKTRNAT